MMMWFWLLFDSVCVYGGGDRKAQINNIETGVEIIIATPGRLNDLVEANVIDVCTITFLVLDEGKCDYISITYVFMINQ